MDALKTLERDFHPGFTLGPFHGRGYHILKPDGSPVRVDGRPYVLTQGHASTWHGQRRTRSVLQELGVIPKQYRAKRDEPERKKPDPRIAAKNPLVIATEVLNDPKATPRERCLAREVLRMSTELGRTRGLAQALGRRIREVEEAVA